MRKDLLYTQLNFIRTKVLFVEAWFFTYHEKNDKVASLFQELR